MLGMGSELNPADENVKEQYGAAGHCECPAESHCLREA